MARACPDRTLAAPMKVLGGFATSADPVKELRGTSLEPRGSGQMRARTQKPPLQLQPEQYPEHCHIYPRLLGRIQVPGVSPISNTSNRTATHKTHNTPMTPRTSGSADVPRFSVRRPNHGGLRA